MARVFDRTANAQPQAGSFASQTSIVIPPGMTLHILGMSGGGQASNFTARMRNANSTMAWSLAPGMTMSFAGNSWSLVASTSGTTTQTIWALLPDGEPSPFGGTTTPTRGTSLTATFVTVPASLTDDHGIAYQPYLGGATVAPCDGVWHVALLATTAGTAPTIGGNTVFVGVVAADIAAATVYVVRIPVAKGTAYAVTGATVVNGWIGPA